MKTPSYEPAGYDTVLTDAEWALVDPFLFSAGAKRGRGRRGRSSPAIHPPPNELGIEVGVAWVTDGLRLNVLLLDDRMLLGGRDFLPLGFEVIDRLDGLGG